MQMNALRRSVTAAVFAALVCLSTLFLQIPNGVGGNLHLGDGFVLVCGWLLGPLYGGIAAGCGSAIADLLSGYAVYLPASAVIKSLMAVIAAFTAKRRCGRLLGAVLSEIWMILGYFLYEALILHLFPSAVLGLAANAVQGIFGILIALLLARLFQSKSFKRMFTI